MVAVREIGQKEKEGELIQWPSLLRRPQNPSTEFSMLSTSILSKLFCLALSLMNWNYLAGPTHSHMHVHYLQRTHTLQQQHMPSGGGGTHVHRMTAHSGCRLWYCRQHCSTLSSLFSAFRPSGGHVGTKREGKGDEDKESEREKQDKTCLIQYNGSSWLVCYHTVQQSVFSFKDMGDKDEERKMFQEMH